MAEVGQLRPLTRRRFLSGVVGIAGLGLFGHLATEDARQKEQAAGAGPGLEPGMGWEAVRAQFPLDPDLVHLAGMLITAHPAPVREAIEAHRAALDGDPASYVLDNDGKLRKRAVEAAAAYFDADPAGVALTDSTTMGLSVLYQGLPLGEGDEVLTTTHDHYSTWYNLDLMAQRRGVRVRKVALYGDPATATEEGMAAAIDQGIGPTTRVVAVTWVHSDTGVKVPIRALAEVVARHNRQRDPGERVLLCVDGVHGFGVEDEDLRSLGCDFFVSGCHKWLHGPRGTGVVYAADPALWDGLTPLIPPFGVKNTQGLFFSPGGFHAFEHRWALDAAFAFHQTIGKERIQARIRELTAQLQEGLRGMPKARVHTPASPALSAGIVGFDCEGTRGRDVVESLRRAGVVVCLAPYGRRCVRVTPGIANTPGEIDAALRALHPFGRA